MQQKAMAALICSLGVVLAACAPDSTASSEAYEDGVLYAGLNLNSRSDADTLLRRMRIVGEKRCGSESERMSLRERLRIRRCNDEFVERSVASIGHPNLTSRLAELSSGH